MQTLCQSRMQVPAANHWAMGQLRMPPSQHRKWGTQNGQRLETPCPPNLYLPVFRPCSVISRVLCVQEESWAPELKNLCGIQQA